MLGVAILTIILAALLVAALGFAGCAVGTAPNTPIGDVSVALEWNSMAVTVQAVAFAIAVDRGGGLTVTATYAGPAGANLLLTAGDYLGTNTGSSWSPDRVTLEIQDAVTGVWTIRVTPTVGAPTTMPSRSFSGISVPASRGMALFAIRFYVDAARMITQVFP
jgi:hypothetical protein